MSAEYENIASKLKLFIKNFYWNDSYRAFYNWPFLCIVYQDRLNIHSRNCI